MQAERKLYSLREQLKIQHRATQRAQVNERKAADSKRRLTSCVPFTTHFIDWYSCHVRLAMSSMMSTPPLLIDQCRKDTDMIWISPQVRVPLNTACKYPFSILFMTFFSIIWHVVIVP